MTKKIVSFIIALSLIFATSFVFAASELKDSADKTGETMQNVVNGAGTVLKDAGEGIKDGAQNIGEDIKDGARNVGEAVNNGARDMTRTDNNDRYTARRTSDNGTIMGMSGTTWTWLVLAIAALAIVGLVWYYAMQNKNEYNNHHND